MKIFIKDKDVIISDGKGNAVSMTTEQVREMLRILNAATNEGGNFFFELLEFTI